MFDLIDGLSSLIGDLGQSPPNEKGTRDVVFAQCVPIGIDTRHLFCFSVNLLNRRRASRRRRDPEYVHLVVLGNPLILMRFPVACSRFVQVKASTR